MINKNATVSVHDVIAMLADGSVSPHMPVVVCKDGDDVLNGIIGIEVYTMKDGSKALAIHTTGYVGNVVNVESAREVFP